ncbi:MAG: MFS transporter [Bradyrhizobium sp.]|uniref:MFS transporter n=1 Tax=Bradyrhizobium sp. TaxID=376 RepID=UPI001DD9B3A6|nr:MFS transporter [Bradyrhizobium sp.]MBV9563320.1 MFS transporter [Bradyrhizobium sp.]
MSGSDIIDVTGVIERQRRNRLVLTVITLSTLMMFLDGYDLQAMAFAAPSIVRSWGIDKAALGIVFSAGLFGILVGGLVFGYLGDRIGRRLAILASALVFGGFTLAAAWAETTTHLIVLRFLAGLGIGGLSPLCYSLNLEYAPNRFRGTVVAIIMVGYVAGASVGGFIAAGLVPIFGWPIVFWIGGVLPLAAAVLCFFTLPESVKFLVANDREPQEVARILNLIEPGLAARADSRFVIHEEAQTGGSGLAAKLVALFDGRLAVVTPVLWFAYIASSMTMFFLNSWTPILAEASGHTPAQAALGLTVLSLGGAIGGLTAGRVLDRFGVIAIAILPLVAAPLVASLGFGGLGDSTFFAALLGAGFFVIGGHQGLNSTVGLFYPSANRATAVGWALSVAKIGSISGPLIGGFLLAGHTPLGTLFLLAAMPPVVVACCVLVLGMSQRRQAAGPEKLDQAAVA